MPPISDQPVAKSGNISESAESLLVRRTNYGACEEI
jgi:hypothetical protein